MLTTTDHARDKAGLIYVYPVLSRRAGGLSIGINLNPNDACNWRCIYCQVPQLKRGSAPEIDLHLLERELRAFLREVTEGDFFERHAVKPEHRRICDLAISGNGEPTSAREFDRIVERVVGTMRDTGLRGGCKLVLITNGSLIQRPAVRAGVVQLAAFGGEVWFKMDCADDAGLRRINRARTSSERQRRNLVLAASLCPTWIQTCVFRFDAVSSWERARDHYLQLLSECIREKVPLQGVLLYGLARPSMQPEARRLAALSSEEMERCAGEIRALGMDVKISI